MFCTNCGVQFTGNFCPNCGAPAYVPPTSQPPANRYPAPPLGHYECQFNSFTEVKPNSILIYKQNADNGKHYNSRVEIVFTDIAAVDFTEWNKKSSYITICIRTVKILQYPFSEKDYWSDPFCLVLYNKPEDAHRIYDFLKAVADINAYPKPERMLSPKEFKYQDLLRYTDTPPAEDLIRQNQANGIACCPKCGSTSLSAGRAGFGLGKAAAGGLVAGRIGLAAGFLGSGKTTVTCLSCGHKWKL